MKRRFFTFAFALALSGAAFPADFGLLVNTTAEYAPALNKKIPAFTGSLSPWVSAILGGKANLYFSGKFTFEYESQNEEWVWPFLAELERTELNFRPVSTVYFTLGRQRFRDNTGMIVSGLFDGLLGNFSLGRMRLSLGAFYTGFLYKETAEILMTEEDRIAYDEPLDYADLNSYFASRRAFVPLVLEFSDLSPRTSLSLTALAQFGFNDTESPELNTQYLELRFGLDPADVLRLSFTGIGEVAETGGSKPEFGFAAAAGADWDIPGALPDMVSVFARWGSGAVNDIIGPFRPVSCVSQGVIFTPTLSGLLTGRISYTMRPHRVFSLSAEGAVCFRTDTETFRDSDLDKTSIERFLGSEFYGALVWVPQSATRVTAAGGAFFPGNAYISDAKIRWKVNLAIDLSL
jgi:hypothetical protein